MEKNKIIEKLERILELGQLLIDEPMKNHTTFRVGGNADFMVIPKVKEEIINTIKFCNENKIELLIVGNGSNLLVRDGGIRGVVMKIHTKFSQITVEDNAITAQTGATLAKVANVALENNLCGMEFASGIPGTLGGAVAMNAGAYGGEMKDIVIQTTYVDQSGNIQILNGEEHQFSYRHSKLQDEKCVILECKLKLKPGNYEEIKLQMNELNKKRKEKQPLNYPSAGSTFKRPEGFFAGKLIEDCGLKGYTIGGAQVSELHSGFIINRENATSKDLLDLIKYVCDVVYEKYGVKLETEVKIIGED